MNWLKFQLQIALKTVWKERSLSTGTIQCLDFNVAFLVSHSETKIMGGFKSYVCFGEVS